MTAGPQGIPDTAGFFQAHKGLAITLSVLGAIGIAILFLIYSWISIQNYGVRAENDIKYAWDNSKNILSQYSLKVQEVAQVPAMQRDDLTKVVTAALEGRYGQGGSKAVFQWIQEQNPKIDSSVYTKLQQVIEAGRDEFRVSQTRVIDATRAYDTSLGYFWRGFWLRQTGYPRINLADYKPIMSDPATAAFQTRQDKPLQLRP